MGFRAREENVIFLIRKPIILIIFIQFEKKLLRAWWNGIT